MALTTGRPSGPRHGPAPHPAVRAARLLEARVHADDRLVLHTYYEDRGTEDAVTVWRYLQRKPIMAAREDTALQTDPGHPLRATLKGNVRLTIRHGDRALAEVKVSELTLIRAGEHDDQWFLPPEEVERTATAAGLPPRPAGVEWVALLAAAVIAGASLGLGLWWFVRRRGRGTE